MIYLLEPRGIGFVVGCSSGDGHRHANVEEGAVCGEVAVESGWDAVYRDQRLDGLLILLRKAVTETLEKLGCAYDGFAVSLLYGEGEGEAVAGFRNDG